MVKLSPILGWFVPVLIAGITLVVSGFKAKFTIVETGVSSIIFCLKFFKFENLTSLLFVFWCN